MRQNHNAPTVAVVMGVAGVGKTTVGERLAERLDWEFIEGDRLHPRENLAKMQSGQPLTDTDRAPWLAEIAGAIDAWRARNTGGVITCSALKHEYRRLIVGKRAGVRLIYLDRVARADRRPLAARRGHFMPANLLDSQFAALEPPGPDEDPIAVSVDQPVERIVDAGRRRSPAGHEAAFVNRVFPLTEPR